MTTFTDGAKIRLQTPDFVSHEVIVTPEIARKWLDTQIKNRRVQLGAKNGYHADMVTGRWHFAGDPIRFDTGGHLIDGQNRLEALAAIDSPSFALPFVVQTGLPPEAQKVMDQGARRTAGQNLALDGIPNGYNLASGYRLMARWQQGRLFDNTRATRQIISNIAVQEWVENHIPVCERALENLSKIRKSGIRPSAGMAISLYVNDRGFGAEIADLFTEIHELSNLPNGSPALTFARRIRNAANSDRTRTLTEVDQLAFLIYTWNSWIQGAPRLSLYRPSGGWDNDNFPEMDL